MYSLEFTNQYLRDLKLARKRKLNESKLNDLIKCLLSGNPLPPKHKDHVLMGNYKGLNECDIEPDWLLIYKLIPKEKVVIFVRTGTHSDLFN